MRTSPCPQHNCSWMWCFNLSELRWHVSNKWFLGAAVHTRSKSITSPYLNDWFLDFRLSGYIPQRAAVSFLNVWSCIMRHILKMYVQLFFFNLFTDKKGCKTWREKTKGAKKIRYPFFLWNHVCLLQCKKNSYPSHFPLVFVLLGRRQRLSQHHGRVSWTASQTKWKHKGLLGAARFENTLLLFYWRESRFSLISW